MNTSPTPSFTLPVIPAKTTGHSKYCTICTPLGKLCPHKFAMSSDWDDDEDQAQNKDKDNNQDQTQTSSNFSTVMTISLKPPKPYISKHFDSMSNETPSVHSKGEAHTQHHDSPTGTE